MTIQKAAEKVFDASRTTYAEGCPVIGNDVELIGFTETTPKKYSEEELAAMEQSALQAAKEADLVVMPMGEHYLQSGEATSRAMIDVPEIQMELFHKVLAVNPNVVVVLFNGRPLDLREISAKSKSHSRGMVPGNRGRKRCCGCPDRKEKSVWQAADELPILRGPGTGQLQRVFHRKTESAGHERAVPFQIS